MTYLILLHKKYLFNFKLTYLIMKRLTPDLIYMFFSNCYFTRFDSESYHVLRDRED